ncbi:MAG: peptidyl-prolyl cis-trans isomerase [Pyrinomonadaceae bacterium]
MKYIGSKFFMLSILFLTGFAVSAQETQERVVDEVVAQVNEGVITLSRVKREAKDVVDTHVQQGKKREEAQKMVDEKQGELIAGLINEELLIQRAKELGLDREIDASLNERFLQIMKQYNLKTLEALYAEMEKTGVDPQEIRELWRKQATRDIVLQREVRSKAYWGTTSKELKDYYDKNRARFTKPETVSISEIFLSFAGRVEAEVREKAKQLVTQLRAGADFAKLSKENSDPGVVTQGAGKTEKLKVTEISELLAAKLKDVKVGGITDPFDAEQVGVVILRVDAREQASSESVFDENAVRIAIMAERAPAEHKKFMASLRDDSYIKISDSYRPLVAPILFEEERKEKTETKQ